MTTYIELPPDDSLYWKDPVALVIDLPAIDETGAVRLVTGTGDIYWFNGASWVLIGSAVDSVADTDSVNLTNSAGVVTANVRLSSDVADAGYILGELAIRPGASPGLRSQVANALIRGLLSATSPVVYNNGTGDISLAALTIAYLTSIIDGSTPSAGQLNELLTGTQASNTTTGVASTGTWGAATSVSLTAGRWMIQGNAGFSENAAVLTTSLSCGISTSATGAGISDFDTTINPYQISGASDALFTTPWVPAYISATTTYYLNTRFFYTSGTPQHRGRIRAVRIG